MAGKRTKQGEPVSEATLLEQWVNSIDPLEKAEGRIKALGGEWVRLPDGRWQFWRAR